MSDFVALDVTVRAFAVAYQVDKVAAKLLPAGSNFDTSHAVSAFIAEALVKKADEDPKSTLSMRLALKGVEALLESGKSTRLSAEQLSKLPKDVVVLAMRFQYEQQQVCIAIDAFAEILASQDRTGVSASVFQEQWKSVARFSSVARALRAALVKYGTTSKDESFEILLSQAQRYHSMFASQLEDKPKLELASAEAKRFLATEGAA